MGQLNLLSRTVSTNLLGNKVRLKELKKKPQINKPTQPHTP